MERDEIVSILRERCDQDFDGECHLTNAEADRIIRFASGAARPTADLGEDGELVAWLGEVRTGSHGDITLHSGMAAIRLGQVRDRLILYREALGDAFGTLHYIFETTDDEQTQRAAAESRDKIDAVLRSGG